MCSFFRFSFEDRFFIDFGSILAPFGFHFGNQVGSQIDAFWHRFSDSEKASKQILELAAGMLRRCCDNAAGMLRRCCARTKKEVRRGGTPPAKSLAKAKLYRSEERRAIAEDLTRLWAVGPANYDHIIDTLLNLERIPTMEWKAAFSLKSEAAVKIIL